MLILKKQSEYGQSRRMVERNIPLDTDNKDNLGLGGDEESTLLLGLARETDLLTLSIAVLLHVLLGTLEDGIALLLVGLSNDSVSLAVAGKIGLLVTKENTPLLPASRYVLTTYNSPYL